MTNSLDSALEPTYYCDFDHQTVKLLAGQLAEEAGDAIDLAHKTVLWVRDEIRFGLDLFQVKASETLEKGYGACYNKSLLLTALLRANGIPARFCSATVNRKFMKPYFGIQYRLINSPFHHCLVEMELDGKKLLAEPTLDKAGYDALFRPLGVPWGIEFTPERQDRLYTEHLEGDIVVHHDIDETLKGNVGNTMMPGPIARAFCNRLNKKAWKRIDAA